MRLIRRIFLGLVSLLLLAWVGLVVYAYWPTGPGVPADQLAGPDDRFIDAGDISLRYRSWGEPGPGRPSLVLMHGFANSVQTFRDLGPALADRWHVVAVDLPGFGLSDKPVEHDYGNASQASVVVDFIAALGLDEVVIGGHSMGGALALHVAEQSPRVTGMILLNPGIITTGVPAITEYFVFPIPRLAARTFADPAFRERFIKTSFVRPEIIDAEVMREVMLSAQTDDYYSGTTQMMKYYASGDEVEMLPRVRVPTLIVWGVEDKSKPDGEAERLRDSLPVARLVMVPDAGHYVHEEKPAEVAAAIDNAAGFWAVRR